MARLTFKKCMDELNNIRSIFGSESSLRKVEILKSISKIKFQQTHDILEYHELLLFMLCYPDNPEVLKLIHKELSRITVFLKQYKKNAPKKYSAKLDGSGIIYSNSIYNPSLDGCEWLLNVLKNDVSLNWSDDYTSRAGSWLSVLTSTVQQDGLSDTRFDGKDWIWMAIGKKKPESNKDLQWLVRNVRSLNCDNNIKDRLFESLETEVSFTLNKSEISRTGNILKHKNHFYQSGDLLRKFDVINKINEPLKNIVEIKGAERKTIIDSAKATLAARERETDPVFYAERVFKAQVERGLDVYLFLMDVDHRLPIENYTGFVAYRNGIPVGYGGGWMFIERCEIGVNIFETFRGGENNLIFSNILRVYNSFFGVSKFVVQPYQFGEDNEEGLQSGAFWFYYKLGFRPEVSAINSIAEKEWKKIVTVKNYRTPITTLKKFTESPVALTLKKANIHFEPKNLSIAVNRFISAKFDGDRSAANEWAVNILKKCKGAESYLSWSELEKKTFHNLAILATCSFEEIKFTDKEKDALVNLIKTKGSDELTFATSLRKHTTFLKALKKFIGKYDFKG